MNQEKNLKTASKLEKILVSGNFAVTAELGPPKSADIEPIIQKGEYLKGAVDAANITDNQTAIARLSSIATAAILLDKGIEPVIQMTCRDRNRIAIQSDILGAYALGIKNILCLTGDHQSLGNHPQAKGVFDLDSIQLIQMLKIMRDEKKFLCGDEIKDSKNAPVVEPRMFIGAAANPFGDPFEFRVVRLAKKIAAGADFIQTQCIFDMGRFRQWMDQVRDRGLHEKTYILAGVTPLRSVRMAQYMNDSVAGVTIPDEIIQRMAQAAEPAEEGVNICLEQIEQLRQIEGIAGVHIMAVAWEKMVPVIVERAGLLPRPSV